MFGYVRPLAAELPARDKELYEAVFCGVCRELRLRYGFGAAFSLSYDLVLIAALSPRPEGRTAVKSRVKRCLVHPIKGRSCARCGGKYGTSYAADCGVILACAKLTDDLRDAALLPKLRAAALFLPARVLYSRAARRRPSAAEAVKRCMSAQKQAEKSGTRSADRLCEPSAAMLAALFRELGGFDPELRQTFGEVGYMLGRYVYFCDALDDLEADLRSGDANPFIPADRAVNEDLIRGKALTEARVTVSHTLGALEKAYSRLPGTVRSPLTDNIIYKGLRAVFSELAEKKQGAAEQ